MKPTKPRKVFLKALTIVAAIVHVEGVQAQDQRGNGGDVLVCETDAGRSVELFDFFEARFLRGQVPLFRSTTVDEMVVEVIDRLQGVDISRHRLYRRWARQFADETLYLPDVELEDIPDSDHWLIPQGCEVQQIAVRHDPPLNGRRFTIDEDLWNELSPQHQAGLVLHELFYREGASRLGHRSSRHARWFMTQMAAYDDLSLRPYLNLVLESDFFNPDSRFDLFEQSESWGIRTPFHKQGRGRWLEVVSLGERGVYVGGSCFGGPCASRHAARHAIALFDDRGTLLWDHQLGDGGSHFRILPSSDDRVFVSFTRDDRCYVKHLDDEGVTIWHASLDHACWDTMPDGRGGLYARNNHLLTRVDTNGAVAWEHEVDPNLMLRSVDADGGLYLADESDGARDRGTLSHFDIAGNQWTHEFPSPLYGLLFSFHDDHFSAFGVSSSGAELTTYTSDGTLTGTRPIAHSHTGPQRFLVSADASVTVTRRIEGASWPNPLEVSRYAPDGSLAWRQEISHWGNCGPPIDSTDGIDIREDSDSNLIVSNCVSVAVLEPRRGYLIGHKPADLLHGPIARRFAAGAVSYAVEASRGGDNHVTLFRFETD